MSSSLWPYGLQHARLLCPWNSPNKNTGVDCHFLLQEIFLTQGSNLHLLHWQAESLPLSHQGSPKVKHHMSIFALDCLWSPPLPLPSYYFFQPDNGKEQERSLVKGKVRPGLLFWQILYAPYSLPPIPDDSENGAKFVRVCISIWICMPLFACEHYISFQFSWVQLCPTLCSFRPHSLQEYVHGSPV